MSSAMLTTQNSEGLLNSVDQDRWHPFDGTPGFETKKSANGRSGQL